MAFSPDGRHLAVPDIVSADERGSDLGKSCIRITDATTGKILRTIGGHAFQITSLAYSPDGRFIASAKRTNGEEFRIWEVATGRQVFQANACSLAFSPDSRRLAWVVPKPPELTIAELQNGEPLFRINHGITSSLHVVWSPDARYVATHKSLLSKPGGEPIRVWDSATGNLVFEHTRPGYTCAFSHDSRRLYISGERELRAWDVATGKEAPAFTHVASGWASTLVLSPDGTRLACTHPGLWLTEREQGTVMIRDSTTGLVLHVLTNAGNQMVLSSDGKRLATIERPFRYMVEPELLKPTPCSIWDVTTGELLNVLPGAGINLQFHPDGKRLATASPGYEALGKNQEQADSVVRVLDTEAPSAQFEFSPQLSGPLAFSSTEPQVALCEHTNESVMAAICDIQTGRKIKSIGPILRQNRGQVRVYFERGYRVEHSTTNSRLQDVEWYVSDLAWSPDGRVIATVITDNNHFADCEVKLWEVSTGRELLTIRRPYYSHIWNLSFSPDGQYLAFSTQYGSETEIYNAASGASIRKLNGGNPAYNSTGRLLATTRGLWDTRTGEPVGKVGSWFEEGYSDVTGTEGIVSFDRSGGRLAVSSGKNDGWIKLLAVPSGKQLSVLRSGFDRVDGLCFTPDGERLVSCGQEGSVRIWDIRTARSLLTLPSSLASSKERQNALVVSPWYARTEVAVSADGNCIATTGDRVRLWRAASAKTK
jgi:WD40 repeat protein